MRTEGRRRERGSAAVEFALVLPILLLVLLAMIQVGVVARDQLLLWQAARAGARAASVGSDDAAIRDAAVAAAPGLDRDAMEVRIDRAGGRGDPVTVTVAYAVPVARFVAGWLLPDEVRLSAQGIMRQEFG